MVWATYVPNLVLLEESEPKIPNSPDYTHKRVWIHTWLISTSRNLQWSAKPLFNGGQTYPDTRFSSTPTIWPQRLSSTDSELLAPSIVMFWETFQKLLLCIIFNLRLCIFLVTVTRSQTLYQDLMKMVRYNDLWLYYMNIMVICILLLWFIIYPMICL